MPYGRTQHFRMRYKMLTMVRELCTNRITQKPDPPKRKTRKCNSMSNAMAYCTSSFIEKKVKKRNNKKTVLGPGASRRSEILSQKK